MRHHRLFLILPVTAACFVMQVQNAAANNIVVTNISVTDSQGSYTHVKFDVAWDNSWRMAGVVTNWDAAWVFVKCRLEGAPGWSHATLSTNDSHHTASPGSTIDAASDGTGVFIYQDGSGSGTVNFTNTQVRWYYVDDGISTTQNVDVGVLAIEMVYIPQGSFELGSGGTELGAFYKYPTSTNTYTVGSEDAITVGTSSGNLYYPTNGAPNAGDQAGPIPAPFPKGYNAFYCMKYEISQGQYADFLNKLTAAQGNTRYPDMNGSWRHTISGSYTNYSATWPDMTCNHLSWPDGIAYADWAGLRPMTELEYEKGCRGTLSPLANEYAWGTTVIREQTGHSGTIGSGSETATPADANCCYGGGASGPVRVGIYATGSSAREAAGATYYGVMNMSGNMFEMAVTVGNNTGRGFTGTHGDGELDGNGDANEPAWPGTDAVGGGFHGGGWGGAADQRPVSYRKSAASVSDTRNDQYGWRGVRTAP